MVEAFVLITCNEGDEETILNKLNGIEEILKVYRIQGPYNIIIKIKGETSDKIKETITSYIKTVDKIRYTLTLKVKT
jgi:DNA-binding Lrp family transcriptional regulator